MSLWTRTQQSATDVSHTHDVKAAYDKGRRDERAARKRHPLVMTALVVLAAVGASMVTLAAVNGSFSEGGAVADQNIAVAAEAAAPVVQDAAAAGVDAARQTGSAIADKSRDLTVRRDEG